MLNQLTITQAHQGLKNKKFSSQELTKACLNQIRNLDKEIHAFLEVTEKEALSQAKEVDKKLTSGQEIRLLEGIPVAIKDIILTRGIRTTAASRILENYIPSFDATVVKRLKEKGIVILGKTNLDEFAHGASTENSAFGPTRNPWDLNRVPGGSSGGSAAAVAADMCLFALGTDTGGSIRQPAGFCSVVGLKPTYGRCSRYGLIAMTSSTDVPGPLTKSVEDAKIVLKAMEGRDENDSTSVESKFSIFNSQFSNLKVGIPKEYFVKGLDPAVEKAVKKAIKKLEELGLKIQEISLPHTKYGIAVYYIITPSEISANLARFDGIRYGYSAAVLHCHSEGATATEESRQRDDSDQSTGSFVTSLREVTQDDLSLIDVYLKSRGQGFGPEVKRRIMLGTYALSAGYYEAYYLKAQKVRTLLRSDFERAFEEVDIIVTPTSPNLAFKIGSQVDDPLKMYLEDLFMVPVSLAGLPAISLPCGFGEAKGLAEPERSGRAREVLRSRISLRGTRGLPIGLQIIGQPFDEETILAVAEAYEKATEWHKKKPM